MGLLKYQNKEEMTAGFEEPRVMDIETESEMLSEKVNMTKAELDEYYVMLAEEAKNKTDDDIRFHNMLRNEAASLKRTAANLRKMYWRMFKMADELETRLRDVENSQRKHIVLPPPPANTIIDYEEKEENKFAQGLNLYKLSLICFIGSFAGVMVELLWCFIRTGHLENRAGLVYGPFNLLYGFGAVMMTLMLYKFRNRSSWISFFGGMIVGSAVEYLCSFLQELLIGSHSWDYSDMPFNLNGRICLLYSVFWGFLGVLWIKNIYPRIAKAILKIPNKAGKIITLTLTIFMLFNAIVSGLAVMRWSQRVSGIEPKGKFYEMIDKRFPNERMEKIYVNMKFEK